MEIDFTVKKTEQGWAAAMDAFFIEATPEVFKWVVWTAAFAGLQFIFNRTHDVAVAFVLVVLLACMYGYFQAVLSKVRFVNFERITSPTIRLMARMGATLILVLGTYNLSQHVAHVLATTAR
ncbi:MAG: hypothetical protein ABL996_19830 [Micropepsaceae bacterium]